MTTPASHAVCGEDRCPILCIWPRRRKRTARGRRKGPPRALRPLPRAAVPTVVRSWKKGPLRAPRPPKRGAAPTAARAGDAAACSGTTKDFCSLPSTNEIFYPLVRASAASATSGASFFTQASASEHNQLLLQPGEAEAA
ncbi:hypothetical protein NDU88_004727 [Pleurodeles waltl]|uniref:Uncharacterized protein n=1 Tax=Pleurodeles waltl TaxID=8319 RepID=A0AAV7KYM8_PLEWA|nr:hypothetical protein NDU88_004727 [Pleurodeles waltl]